MYRAGDRVDPRASGCAAPRSCIDPCIPRAWPGFDVAFRYHSSRYEIGSRTRSGVTRGVARVEVDGAPLALGPGGLALVDDGATACGPRLSRRN